ncbi:hypothetical protein ACT2YA_001834, partial [Klebsiella variicola]
SKKPILPDGLFAFQWSGNRADMSPRWRCAYRGYTTCSPDKVRSTASGENPAIPAPLSSFKAT